MGRQAQREDIDRPIQAVSKGRKRRMRAEGVLVATDELQSETAKTLNDLARHQLIEKLLRDILVDVMVCRLEGWDHMEFINMLSKEIEGLKKRR